MDAREEKDLLILAALDLHGAMYPPQICQHLRAFLPGIHPPELVDNLLDLLERKLLRREYALSPSGRGESVSYFHVTRKGQFHLDKGRKALPVEWLISEMLALPKHRVVQGDLGLSNPL